MRVKQRVAIGVFLLLALWLPISVSAQSSSASYKVDETFFGSGGVQNACSTAYCSDQTAGSLGAGATSSTSYAAFAGFTTPYIPALEMIVSGATVDLGVLSSSATASGAARAGTCNCSFTVRTYLSGSYVVVTMSNPPTSENNDILAAKTTLGAPIVGKEEFGMNVVANTSPSMGANPVNVPDNTFADGQAATGYSTPNQFKYGVGDVIASSPKTTGNPAIGETDYTISYIADIKPLTKAGLYTMNQNLVVVATY